jgi:hypothetical protein
MSNPPAPSPNIGLMNYTLRMVIPLRREFGRALDVQHFLHDLAYAKEILDEARTSQDPRLREYADYLNGKLFGPRNAPASPNATQKSGDVQSSQRKTDAIDSNESDQAERNRLLDKYKSGLR